MSNEYDDGAIGQRTEMSDGSGNTAWEYTPRGEVEKESKVVTGSGTFVSKWAPQLRWGHHPDGSMRWMTYPGGNNSEVGEKITLEYLPQKALATVYSDTNSYYYLQSATYDAAGRLDVRSLGATSLAGTPVLKTNLDYYPWNQQGGRLKYLQSGIPSSITSLQSFEYDYDPVGNIDWIKDYKAGGTQTQTFNYDTLDRLKDAVASGGVGGTYAKEYYTYNTTTGNLATKAGVTYTYGDSDHPHAVTSLSNGNSYGYDDNGNMTDRTIGTSDYDLVYDAENRLVDVSGSADAEFVYDGDGNRVKGTAGGTTTVYIGAAFEWTGSTSTMKRYYYAGTVRIAVRVGSGTGTTGLSWLLGDHLGSTSLTVSVTAVKTGELRYKPFGETRYSYGSTPTTFKFTGQREQVEIGLYYYQASWFDSSLGRFVSADSMIPEPGNPLAWDRYLYVFGNPLRYIDPSGNKSIQQPVAEGVDLWMEMNEAVLWVDHVAELDDGKRYGVGSQYIPIGSYNYKSEHGARIHENLCGHLAFAAIYETKTYQNKSLDMIWDIYPTHPKKGSTFGGWIRVINGLPGWSATSKWFGWRNLQEEVFQTLSNGSYIILGCTLDKKTGLLVSNSLNTDGQDRYVGHWSVLVASSDYGVTIYNPYTNSYQVYTWKEMKGGFGVAILVNYRKPVFPKVTDELVLE